MFEYIFKTLRRVRSVWYGEEEPHETSSTFTKTLMGQLGVWADSNEIQLKGASFKVANLIVTCSHLTLVLVMANNLIQHEGVFNQFVEDACITLGSVMVSTKAIFYLWKRQQITHLIDTVNEKNLVLLAKAQQDVEIGRLRRFYYLVEMIITIPFLFNAVFLILVMIVIPFFAEQPYLPCPAKFPFDTTPYSRGFWVAYVYESIDTLIMSTVYALSVTTIGNNYHQIVLQFDVMGHELRQLGHKELEKWQSSSREYQQAIKGNLIRIIEEHQNIFELVNFCNEFLFGFFVLLLGVVTLNFCLIIYSASIAVNEQLADFLKFMMYFSYISIIFFYWCWLGNEVVEKSEKMAVSAYFSNWLEGDSEFKVLLLHFMAKTQSPAAFHAKPFYRFSLDTFVSVMAKAFQYFAVLKDLQ